MVPGVIIVDAIRKNNIRKNMISLNEFENISKECFLELLKPIANYY